MEDAQGIVLTAHSAGLSITTFGKSHTYPGHYYGPAMRPYYLIHYILSGKGVFQSYHGDSRTYRLHQGQGFLIEPGFVNRYESDASEPWSYIWVAFSGSEARSIIEALGLSQEEPIFSCTPEQGHALEQCIDRMLEFQDVQLANSFRRMAQLNEFLAILAEAQKDTLPSARADDYIASGLAYIRSHLSEPFTVQNLADYLRLNRSYMTTLFKEKIGMSPHEYIQQCRINKSGHLLESSSLSIETIAYSCGYAKTDSYTRAFQRQKDMSPSAYRRLCRENKYSLYLVNNK